MIQKPVTNFSAQDSGLTLARAGLGWLQLLSQSQVPVASPAEPKLCPWDEPDKPRETQSNKQEPLKGLSLRRLQGHAHTQQSSQKAAVQGMEAKIRPRWTSYPS